jgi:hypothetical protein
MDKVLNNPVIGFCVISVDKNPQIAAVVVVHEEEDEWRCSHRYTTDRTHLKSILHTSDGITEDQVRAAFSNPERAPEVYNSIDECKERIEFDLAKNVADLTIKLTEAKTRLSYYEETAKKFSY